MSHLSQNSKYKNNAHLLSPQKKVKYSDENHQTWQYLYSTQILNLQDLAHTKILECLQEISLPKNHIPQLDEVSKKLYKKTGWQVYKVVDLIDGELFFQLLSDRKFPSTLYIRSNDESSLSRDPDIFHELFGHCPALFDEAYANLFQKFGLLGLQLDQVQRAFLQRLFWFTFETGLIQTKHDLKIYGGSLLSSIKESRYAIEDVSPLKRNFDMVDIFRTSYRADLLQPVYYIISDFSQLHAMLSDIKSIKKNIEIAYELGEFSPLFPIEEQYSKYINYNICKHMQESLMIA